MSILVDTNLLIYASLPAMGEHRRARDWLTRQYEDPGLLVGLCWPVLYAFVRLTTSRRIMGEHAVSLGQAWSAATQFIEQDNARLVEAGPGHQRIAGELIATPGLASNDVPDVHLAALAIEHGLTLCSHDHGFARFERLAWRDPISS